MIQQFQRKFNQTMANTTLFIYRWIANTIPFDNSQLKLPAKLGWWIEIFTIQSPCLYYFGEYDSLKEAEDSRDGYVRDLLEEGTKDIKLQLQFCQPKRLTVGF